MALKVCDDVDDNKTKLSAKERAKKDSWGSSNDQLKTMEWTKGFWKDLGLNGGVPPLFSTSKRCKLMKYSTMDKCGKFQLEIRPGTGEMTV